MSEMTPERIPAETGKFIERYIRSNEHLEILCLLAGKPSVIWSEETVFQEIQSSRESVRQRLHAFHVEGFLSLEPGGGYRFNPRTRELEEGALDLAKLYPLRRVSILEKIYKTSE